MLEIGLIVVGKAKDKALSPAINQYQKMIKPYALLHLFELKSEKFSDSNKIQAQRMEQQRIMECIASLQKKNKWQPILLTETGRNNGSPDFATWLSKIDGTPLFIIGGALGFDEAFKASFNLKLSLSGLTMPHELARLVLTEQLYRATTILNSKSYHY